MNFDFRVDMKFNKGTIFFKKKLFRKCNFLDKCSLTIKIKKNNFNRNKQKEKQILREYKIKNETIKKNQTALSEYKSI
jgi:hypothetical protein